MPEHTRSTRECTRTTREHARGQQPNPPEGRAREEEEKEEEEEEERKFCYTETPATGKITPSPLPLALSPAHDFESHAQTKRNDFRVRLTPPTSDLDGSRLPNDWAVSVFKLESAEIHCIPNSKSEA
jgi:hypothetical protein